MSQVREGTVSNLYWECVVNDEAGEVLMRLRVHNGWLYKNLSYAAREDADGGEWFDLRGVSMVFVPEVKA